MNNASGKKGIRTDFRGWTLESVALAILKYSDMGLFDVNVANVSELNEILV